LATIDDIPGDCDATTRILAEYWLSIHPAPGCLPGRRHFDPIDLPPSVLPFLILSEVLREPFDVRYRLVGTEVVSLLGADVTGMKLSERKPRRDREGIFEDYRTAVEDGRISFGRITVFDADRGYKLLVERTHFPLAANGRDVDMVLSSLVRLERSRDEIRAADS